MKRQRGERAKSLAFVLALLFAFVSFTPSAKADSQTQTFKKDLDFSIWSKDRTELVGSDQGIKLETNPATDGYYTSGTLTYKFSPGGTNHWIGQSAAVGSVHTEGSWYAWGSNHNSGSVLQMDPETGAVIKTWTTSTSAVAGTPGINADYWVSNLSPYNVATQTYSCSATNMNNNLCYSVSHIIPSQNKIVTRSIPSTSSRNLSTISFDTVGHNLWVGDSVNNEVVILNTATFDNTASALSYETVSTTNSPYRSAFSQGANALCFSAYQVGIECISGAANHTDMTISEDQANDIYVDENGDFWYSGHTIYKIRPEFSGDAYSVLSQEFAAPLSSLSDWDYQNSEYVGVNQIAIIPSGIGTDSYQPKLVLSTLKSSEVNYYPLTNKALPLTTTTVGAVATMFDGNNGGLDANYRANVNISPNGDAIFAGVGRCDTGNPCGRFYDVLSKLDESPRSNSSNLYSLGELPPTNPESLHHFYMFENFIAPSFGLSDSGVKIEYSADNKSWIQADAHSNIGLANSADLYIKVTLTGTQSSSAILKSLALSYQSSLADNLKAVMDRSMYKSATDRNNGSGAISTFEKGQRVFVRTKIFEPSLRRDNVTIEEMASGVDGFATIGDKNFVYKTGTGDKCTTVISDRTIAPPTASGQTYTFTIPFVTMGLTCIDYEYTSS